MPSLSFTVSSEVHSVVQSLFTSNLSLLASFQISDFSHPSAPVVYHRIEMGNVSPMFAKARRLPPDKLESGKKEFSDLLAAGIIRPSISPWFSTLNLVKKDSSYRPCTDFRILNSVTIYDIYPLSIFFSFSMVPKSSLSSILKELIITPFFPFRIS